MSNFDIHGNFWLMGGDDGYDPVTAFNWDGVWAAQNKVTMDVAPDDLNVLALPDLTSPTRDMTYAGTAGKGTLGAINGHAALDLSGSGAARVSSTAMAALVPAGANVEMVIAVVFSLRSLASSYSSIFGWKDEAKTFGYTMLLHRGSGNTMQLWKRDAAFGNVILNFTISANQTNALVLKMKSDGTFNLWVNGFAVNANTMLSTQVMTAPTRFSFGALETTASAALYACNGLFAFKAAKVGTEADPDLLELCENLTRIYNAG